MLTPRLLRYLSTARLRQHWMLYVLAAQLLLVCVPFLLTDKSLVNIRVIYSHNHSAPSIFDFCGLLRSVSILQAYPKEANRQR
jgi:hypothetical protein